MNSGESYEIGQRIRQLRTERKESQECLADALGLKNRETVKFWESGDREIKASHIVRLANHFNVTADYILGLGPKKPLDAPPDLSAMADFTGLDIESLDYLHELTKSCFMPGMKKDRRLEMISELLNIGSGNLLIALLARYAELKSMERERALPNSDEYIRCEEALKKLGYVISTPAEQAQLLLDGKIRDLACSVLSRISQKWKAAPGADTPGAGQKGSGPHLPSQDNTDGRL